jgi:pimeloyl-ACP methyl ester carboxylesterase
LKRVPQIGIPTSVLWGQDDRLASPNGGRRLFDALTCKKEFHLIAGNGYVGHLDRNREKVFDLTAEWVKQNLV